MFYIRYALCGVNMHVQQFRANSRDTLNHMETWDIWSTTSGSTTLTLSISTVLSTRSWAAACCAAYTLYLLFVQSLAFPKKQKS